MEAMVLMGKTILLALLRQAMGLMEPLVGPVEVESLPGPVEMAEPAGMVGTDAPMGKVALEDPEVRVRHLG